MILNKAGFNSWISFFFSNYLINRQTQYVWNYFVFLFFKADIGIGQGSALSSILFTIYIAFIFHIFKKRSKILLSSILVLSLLFVNNSLLISQEKSYEKSNTNIFCSYSVISSFCNQFGLAIKHDKLEIFHFFRFTKNTQLPPLDL